MVNFGELHLPNLSRNNVGELQLPNPLTNNLCFSSIRAVVVTELAVVDSGSLLKKTFARNFNLVLVLAVLGVLLTTGTENLVIVDRCDFVSGP